MHLYLTFLRLHSGFRYIVFVLLVLAVLQSLVGLFGKKNYTEGNRKINLFAMISAHTQFLIGLILSFYSPLVKYGDMGAAMKDATTRYWTVEHLVMMLFAIILITIGHSRSKKALDAMNKHKSIALFYGLAFIVIIVAIYQSGRPLLGMS